MPYTPPSHRSPASSTSSSPDVSRRSSIASGQRPSLPRSASYLNKHRRTPSVTSVADDAHASSSPLYGGTADAAPVMGSGNGNGNGNGNTNVNGSIRKSPPPVTDDRGIPNGAIISPPDSASSGSEDEGHPGIRGRKLGQLKDLRDAVSQIPQARTPSPSQEIPSRSQPSTPRGIMRTSFSTTSLSDLPRSGRRISHVRSATEPNASVIMSSTDSLTVSEDSDDDMKKKPQMVRKKSGELVRPALRLSQRRPSSMPGTPVFAKVVHFDSHLEHIRHFLQVDRPLAVSAGSSPVENYESDTEYPFPGAEDKQSNSRSPPFEWELVTTNFPHDSPASRRDLPARLEKVWLSADQKSMLGSVAVANLSFQKLVVCRFTLDYWKTTSEVVAEWSHEIRPRETPIGRDRFTFSIKLSDTINLESKTLLFCIRYNVNNQEYWDNNNLANFQVDFKKKFKPQNGKNNFQGAASRPLNALPRSNRRQPNSTTPRPVSMPASFEEFGDKSKLNYRQPIHEYLGESGPALGLRLKNKSTSNLASDNITKNLTSPSGVVFANRYDFAASLNAAVQAAKESVGKDKDALYMKKNVRSPPPVLGMPAGSSAFGVGQQATLLPSPNIGLPSSSYEELVSKYCFFGSKQSNPVVKNGVPRNGEYDGSKGDVEPRSTSPIPRRTGPAAHHGLHLKDLKPFMPATTGHSTSFTASQPKILPFPATGRDQSSTPKSTGSARSPSPAFSVASTSPSDAPFHVQQQVLSERFPWGGEAHTATAIRG